MKTQDIKKMAQAWQSVQEASKKKLDPVDQDELKGTHAQRKDKDIDNDGDVDSSDEYLHNRRKAVKHAMKKEANNYGPGHIGAVQKMLDKEREAKKAKDAMKKESSEWSVYKRILENRAMHYKGATPPDPMDKGLSPGGKKMKADVMQNAEFNDYDEKGHDDASKAGRVTKKSPARRGDSATGDKNVVNPVKDTSK